MLEVYWVRYNLEGLYVYKVHIVDNEDELLQVLDANEWDVDKYSLIEKINKNKYSKL